MKKISIWFLMLLSIFMITGCSSQSNNITLAEKGLQDYYVNVDWLKDNINKVTLIDARPDAEYKVNHIEGSINITWQALANMNVKQGEKDWGVILGKDELGAKLASYGIDKDQQIIIYNDPKGLGEEGRIYWDLKIAGLDNVKILDGGITQWIKNDGEMTTNIPDLKPSNFTISTYDDSRIATTEYVKENLGKVVILDTRSADEYNGLMNHGENYKGEKIMGHIPGALSLPFSDFYNVDGTIKSVKEITKILDDLGVKKGDEIVTHCTVGIRSGFAAEVLRMSGYEGVKNYNGSFSEWVGLGNAYEK